MSEETKSNKFSRRKFVKGIGSSIAGGYILSPAIAKAAKKISKEAKDFSEGKVPLSLKVNESVINVMIEPRTTLAELLRDELKLTGTKVVCNHGECGGCTVLLNNKAVYSCHLLALDAAGKDVTTIEGLSSNGKLHKIQQAFVDEDGLQCGFCTPGQVMAAAALLYKYSKPDKQQIMKEMSGNLCRCAAYPNIIKSVLSAVEKSNG
jgi:aerobic-type carbon monoxide dehydrogenase small subunit (CoxS/CutS family)